MTFITAQNEFLLYERLETLNVRQTVSIIRAQKHCGRGDRKNIRTEDWGGEM